MVNKYMKIAKISYGDSRPDAFIHEHNITNTVKSENMYKINYKCSDKSGYLFIDKCTAEKNEYFNAIIELTDENELSLNFSFSEIALLYAIDTLYENSSYTSLTSFENLYNIVQALLFFNFESNIDDNLCYFYENHLDLLTNDNFLILEELLFKQNYTSKGFVKMLMHSIKTLPINIQEKYNDKIIILDNGTMLIKAIVVALDGTYINTYKHAEAIFKNWSYDSTEVVHLNIGLPLVLFINPLCEYYNIKDINVNQFVDIYKKRNDEYIRVDKTQTKRSYLYENSILIHLKEIVSDNEVIYLHFL